MLEIRTLHTLGPTGTNCEAAAMHWLSRRCPGAGRVELYDSLEEGLETLPRDSSNALLACAVYPHLHKMVFRNLDWLRLVDSFTFDTFNMVLASRGQGSISTVASHEAPALLAGSNVSVKLVNSNAAAAIACGNGEVDACITTRPAAKAYGLAIVDDFGVVPMAFTIHQPYRTISL